MRTVIAGAVAARRTAPPPGTDVTYDAGESNVAFEPAGDFSTPSFTVAAQSDRILLGFQGVVDFTTPTMTTDVRQGSSSGTKLLPYARTRTGTGNAGTAWALQNESTGSTNVWCAANTKLANAILGLSYYNVSRIGDVQYVRVAIGGVTNASAEVTLSTPNTGSLVVMYSWLTGSMAAAPVTIETPPGDPGYTSRENGNIPGLDILAFATFERTRQGTTTLAKVESDSFDNDYDFHLLAMVLEPTGAPWPSGSIGNLVDSFPGPSISGMWAGTAIAVGPTVGITQSGTTAATSGQLIMQPTNSTACWTGVSSAITNYSLVNSNIYCNPVITGSTGTGTGVQWRYHFTVGDSTDSTALYAEFQIVDSGTSGVTLECRYNNTGSTGTTTSVTYNSTDHAFLRIRDSGGDIFWETSSTGAVGSWALLRQLSVDAGTAATYAPLNNTVVGISTENAGTATGVEVRVNGVNI